MESYVIRCLVVTARVRTVGLRARLYVGGLNWADADKAPGAGVSIREVGVS